MDVSFDECTMHTQYRHLKMDAHKPLLLSEGICHQLGIIFYYPGVESSVNDRASLVTVPTTRVGLVQSIRLSPQQSVMATVGLQFRDRETLWSTGVETFPSVCRGR